MRDAEADRLSNLVIAAFFAVYNGLKPGYLEQVYVGAVCVELRHRRIPFQRERKIDVRYRGEVVGQYRADILVNDALIVEVKAGNSLHESARWQTLNYLRATGLTVGLILHFGAKPSFQRVVA